MNDQKGLSWYLLNLASSLIHIELGQGNIGTSFI